MGRKQKNNSNIKSSYINEDVSQSKEPDYKELYFNLIKELSTIKEDIERKIDKSFKEITSCKSMQVDYEAIDIFSKNKKNN